MELFFKAIKQHLRIKAFYGVSENAVKTQILDRGVGLRAGGVRAQTARLEASVYQVLQILSLTLF
jgi:hypothetical protein